MINIPTVEQQAVIREWLVNRDATETDALAATALAWIEGLERLLHEAASLLPFACICGEWNYDAGHTDADTIVTHEKYDESTCPAHRLMQAAERLLGKEISR